MRLLKLHLVAFGAFANRTLDLSQNPHALSVVYGKNEAGKSTSLRAYEGLLFGIDSTVDAFRHPTKKMRIGGTFLSDAGEELTVFRRRGRKDTLVDESDKPIDGSRLKKLLRGVDRELFGALYGLDHVRLREGKKALFAEGGSVAEGLFEASLSGAGVGQLRKTLRSEADALFTPRATQRPLSEALRAYAAATANARMYATSSVTYQRQLAAIEAAKDDRRNAEQELLKCERARRRIERGLRVFPLLVKRRNLLAKLSELGDVAELPESASTERERVQAERLAAEDSLRELGETRQRALYDLAGLPQRDLPFDPGEARAELSELLGRARDNPQRRAELDAERTSLEIIVAEQPSPGNVFDAATEHEVLDLLTARDEGRRAVTRASEQRDEERAVEQNARVALAALAPRPESDIERLRLLLDVGEAALLRSVQREEQLARCVEQQVHASRLASELGVSSLAALEPGEVPAAEQVEGWRRRFESLLRIAADHAAKLAELDQNRARALREQHELLARGPALSEQDLEHARSVRDSALEVAFSDSTEHARAIARQRVRTADSLSDRLRIEADRLARLATVERSLASAESAMHERSLANEKNSEETRLLTETVHGRLRSLSGPLLDPELAATWFARRRAAAEALAQSRAARSAAEAIDHEIATIAASLRALGLELRADLGAEPDVVAELRGLVARGRSVLSEEASLRSRFEKLTSDRDASQTNALRAELRTQAVAISLQEVSSRAEALLSSIGLKPNALREEVVRLAQHTRRAADAQSKLRKISSELVRARELEERLVRKTKAIAAALDRRDLPLDPILAAELMLADLSRAQREALARREIERSCVEIDERFAAATERKRRADAELVKSVLRARASSEAELPLLEQKSLLRDRLRRDVESAEAAIDAASGGVPIAELSQEYTGFDLEQAELEDARLEEERVTLERRKEQASQQRVSLEQAAAQWHESRAAEFAEQANSHLARAKSLALHFFKLRLGSALLDREVDHYQSIHQAPVITRASEHFRVLSGGSYQGVRVTIGDDDQPELSSLRGADEVPIHGLSDGAKDQLFLALRLATIERHAEGVESLPLVFDDVLVHFDDERSEAALELFATIAPRMQVLLFTHQERVVELAEKLGQKRVQIVHL